MSREKEKNKIRELIEKTEGGPAGQMKIFIQGKHYKSIGWDRDLKVNVPTIKNAESLISFLTDNERARIIKLKQELNVSDIPDDKLLKDFFDYGKLPG